MNKLARVCMVCTLTILPTWLDAKVYKEPAASPAPAPVQQNQVPKANNEGEWNELPVKSGVVPGVPLPYAYAPASAQQNQASQANNEDEWNELPAKSGVVAGVPVPYSAPSPKDAASIARSVTAKLEAIDKRGYLDDLTLKELLKDIDKKNSKDVSSTVFKPAWEGLLDVLMDIKINMDAYDRLSESRESAKIIEKARKKMLNIQDKVVALLNKIEDAIEDKRFGWDMRNKLLNIYEHLTNEWVNNPYGSDAGYKDIIKGLIAKMQADQPHKSA